MHVCPSRLSYETGNHYNRWPCEPTVTVVIPWCFLRRVRSPSYVDDALLQSTSSASQDDRDCSRGSSPSRVGHLRENPLGSPPGKSQLAVHENFLFNLRSLSTQFLPTLWVLHWGLAPCGSCSCSSMNGLSVNCLFHQDFDIHFRTLSFNSQVLPQDGSSAATWPPAIITSGALYDSPPFLSFRHKNWKPCCQHPGCNIRATAT
jgi:hypothetical protein